MKKIDKEYMHKMLCHVENFKDLKQEHKDMLYKICTILIDAGILDEKILHSVAKSIIENIIESHNHE